MAYTLTYELINNNTSYKVTGYTDTPDYLVIPSEYNGKPITSISADAFFGCSSLTSVVIPDSVTTIGYRAFADCNNLTSVVIPDSVTSIGGGAFSDCYSLTSVVIPDSVTSIGEYAFAYCESLTSVVIGNSVTSIVRQTFRSCDGLTSVVIGDSVTTIEEEAFAYCTSLTSIVIPDSVTSIGTSAFYECTNLTKVTLLAKTPASLLGAYTFTSNPTFYCFNEAIEAYKTTTNWNAFANNFVADDMRLYFTMNSRAQKKYFANKEDLEGKSNIGHTHSYETISYTGEPDTIYSDPEYWSLNINNGLQIKQEHGPDGEKIQITPTMIEMTQGDASYNQHGATSINLASGSYVYNYDPYGVLGALDLGMGAFEYNNGSGGVSGHLHLQTGTFRYHGLADSNLAELNLQNSTLSGHSPQVNNGSTWTLAFPNTTGTLATEEWTTTNVVKKGSVIGSNNNFNKEASQSIHSDIEIGSVNSHADYSLLVNGSYGGYIKLAPSSGEPVLIGKTGAGNPGSVPPASTINLLFPVNELQDLNNGCEDITRTIATQEWVNDGYALADHSHDATTLTPDDISAAWEEHYHNANEITAGTLPIERGGTGSTTASSARTSLGVPPTSHASSSSTYGLGTTANYGHVKIQNGDLNGKSNTNGVAAGLAHTHSQYAPLNTNLEVIADGIVSGNSMTLESQRGGPINIINETSDGTHDHIILHTDYLNLSKQEPVNDEESSHIMMYNDQLDISVRGQANTTDGYDSEITSGISVSSHQVTIGDINGIDNDPEYDTMAVNIDADRVNLNATYAQVNNSKIMTARDFDYNSSTGILTINTSWED